jgi:hypothetical protein
MNAGVMVISGAASVLLGCTLVGGPIVLADWLRTRRQAVIARQIALTDALDAQFGALLAPMVTKPLFGPWEVRIAVPLLGSAVLTRIIAVTDDVFAGVEGKRPMRYRMLLRVTPTVWRAGPDGRAPRAAKPWDGTSVAAA